jgi:hypothetical protein
MYYNPEDISKPGVWQVIIDYKYNLISYTCRSYKGVKDLLKAILKGTYNKNIKNVISDAHVIEICLIKEIKSEAEARYFKKEQIELYQPDLNVHKNFNVW